MYASLFFLLSAAIAIADTIHAVFYVQCRGAGLLMDEIRARPLKGFGEDFGVPCSNRLEVLLHCPLERLLFFSGEFHCYPFRDQITIDDLNYRCVRRTCQALLHAALVKSPLVGCGLTPSSVFILRRKHHDLPDTQTLYWLHELLQPSR